MALKICHVLLTLVMPPLLFGVIVKTKAAFGGRVGAPLLQPYYDLLKLLRKDSVFSQTTTWVFRAGPVTGLATTLLATLVVPYSTGDAPISFTGDMILFCYLFALGRFFTTAAALDTGSAFEGMGAAREVTFACLTEPAILFGLLVLARLSHALDLAAMVGSPLWSASGLGDAALALLLGSWFLVLLAENCRIPFDDPNTHLELTMIHEVMVLDHSGPAFGMILYGATLKLFALGALIVRVAVPVRTGNPWGDLAAFAGAMLLLAVLVGVVESIMARLRMTSIANVLATASVLAAFGVVLLIVK